EASDERTDAGLEVAIEECRHRRIESSKFRVVGIDGSGSNGTLWLHGIAATEDREEPSFSDAFPGSRGVCLCDRRCRHHERARQDLLVEVPRESDIIKTNFDGTHDAVRSPCAIRELPP